MINNDNNSVLAEGASLLVGIPAELHGPQPVITINIMRISISRHYYNYCDY